MKELCTAHYSMSLTINYLNSPSIASVLAVACLALALRKTEVRRKPFPLDDVVIPLLAESWVFLSAG